MSFKIQNTVNGYQFFECSSAIQKAIRRGDEKTALFFTVEMSLSNYDDYLWRRFFVIVSEDIGFANPNAPVIINSLYDFFKEHKKRKNQHKPERLFLIHAVLFLVRSPKSRLVDWATCGHFGSHQDHLIEIPEYAFDMHTYKGRKKGLGIDHFAEHSAHLENHKKQFLEDDYKDLTLKYLRKK